MDGDVYKYLQPSSTNSIELKCSLSLNEKIQIAIDVLSALVYIHANNIKHHNLKP